MNTPIRQYLREVERAYAAGNATEHTYRPAFKALVESFGKDVRATNEPKRVACGAPDFIVSREDVPVGFIECKDVGTSLDETERTDQLKRYFPSLDNLILTDYMEFRYYIHGEQKMHLNLARVDGKGKMKLMQGADEHLAMMFDAFLTAESATISTPKELAARMANIAKVIREAIEKAFDLEGEAGTLHGEFESFRATILSDLKPAQFADMYAQTVCYGMFSARVNVPDQLAAQFTREHAAYDLPKTNPFLREVFEYIAGTKLDPSIVWAVDLLADVLRHCNMAEILKNFGKSTRQEDPVVHFYETFLAAYDPALRETRGVYYTPEPVVRFIVRSIDAILKRDFACPAGLADHSRISAEFADSGKKDGKIKQDVHRVQILDPATGTGTFLYETIRHVGEALSANQGLWAGEGGYVARHLLPRVYGFELMMAPYAVAHLKLGWLLKETGYDFAGSERLQVYLTNTLEEAEVVAGPLLALANQIAREANAAGRVKTECPIMVIMGNPPYSGHSANKGKWVADLLKKRLPVPDGAPGYFECDGKPLGERNPKWLNDDYVKFIRFAQYRIELTGYGILGFITNHGYLDNPTFRGMRQSLMRSFDQLYLLDLHGNAKKKETCPDGSKDENVFDIMQGVAIALFIRKPGKRIRKARVFHAELFGTRKDKYVWLAEHAVKDVDWQELRPEPPYYLFKPQDSDLLPEYQTCVPVTEVFQQFASTVTTARNHFTMAFDKKTLLERIQDFVNPALSDGEVKERYGLEDVSYWNVAEARRRLAAGTDYHQHVQGYCYRPLDFRFVFYHSAVCERMRPEIMQHMKRPNVALLTHRPQSPGEFTFAYCTDRIGDQCVAANKTAGGGNSFQFPLYLYPNGGLLESSPWPPGEDNRRPNLRPPFVEALSAKLHLRFVSDGHGDLRKTFGPEDVFHYVYAVLHSPTFRSRYSEFLKVDFPRLPLTGNKAVFARLVKLGAELVDLHLLRDVPDPRATYPKPGDNLVTRTGTSAYKQPKPRAPGRVYVNDFQYFEDVPPEVWNFQVGAYQVCEKWLKDRKGRVLSYEDIEHYRKITEAVRQTLRLMVEIDRATPTWPLE